MALVAPSGRSALESMLHGPVARLHAIDVARGLALVGMVTFHTAWDLAYWGWTDASPAQSPAWMAFGHTVAATFLFMSGFCLMLARHRGIGIALRRIGVLAATAGIITAATRWLFPDEFIFFGIIHCIAVSNLVGLAFLHVPARVVLIAGCVAAITPSLATSYRFGTLFWWCMGLARVIPPTLDYRPLLPWIAFVLFGIAAAQMRLPIPDVGTRSRWAGALAWAGRRSLSIYVLHQPLLFGLFFLIAAGHPRDTTSGRNEFSRQCVAQCTQAGAGQAGCSAACDCMLARASARPSAGAVSPQPSASELHLDAQSCLRTDPLSR